MYPLFWFDGARPASPPEDPAAREKRLAEARARSEAVFREEWRRANRNRARAGKPLITEERAQEIFLSVRQPT
jgi:hypothetical protein